MFDKFHKIKRSGLNLFDIKDISIILNAPLPSARVIAARMTKRGILTRLKRDLYLLTGADVNDFEIANKLISPSYVSFESALNYWGLSTQIPELVTSAARRSKHISIGDKEYVFGNLPKQLFSPGIVKEKTFFIGGPEKALADMIYYASLGKRSITFDILDTKKIDKRKFSKLLKYYPDKVKKLAKELIP